MPSEVWIYSILSVLAVSLIAFVGLFTIYRKDYLDKYLIYVISFAAGALIGDAFIHLLPEVIKETGFGLNVSLYVILGIIFMFIVEKFIHWHHCHHHYGSQKIKPYAIMNLIGDGVHNFIDGIIIGISYLVSIPVGIATTLAVSLHEIPQEIGDFGILLHGGFSKNKALLFNFLSALTAVLGVIVALLTASRIEGITTFLLPVAAGYFIYISLADLIPELHKETNWKKSTMQLAWFLLGVSVMIALL